MLAKSIMLVCTMTIAALQASAEEPVHVLPVPSEISSGQGFLVIDPSFRIALNRDDSLLLNARRPTGQEFKRQDRPEARSGARG